MTGTMKAVSKQKAGYGADLIEAPIPATGPCDVLVRVQAAAICGTDVHIYKWDKWAESRIHPPLIFGHEFAGEVVETGSEVHSVKAGDRISAESHIACGHCIVCRNGQQHICSDLKILGMDTRGCFSDYAVIPASCAWKNATDLPLHIAAVQEPLGNAVYTVMEADVPGKRVVILGDGPAGLFATGVARACGAGPIWLAGTFDFALNIGMKMGADRVFNVRKAGVDVVSAVLEETRGAGADAVLEMSGSPRAVADGLKLLRKGGEFMAFGLPSEEVSVNLATQIIFKGINIRGINGRLMYRTWIQMRNLLDSGRLDPSPVVTHNIPLADFKKGFDLMLAPERVCGKIVMIPQGRDHPAPTHI